MKRHGATSNGLRRRLRDLKLALVGDPRVAAKVDYSLELMLTALVVGMVTSSRSLRRVEQRTGQIAKNPEAGLGITTRIADNTFGKLLPRLDPCELVVRLRSCTRRQSGSWGLCLPRRPTGRGATARTGRWSPTGCGSTT